MFQALLCHSLHHSCTPPFSVLGTVGRDKGRKVLKYVMFYFSFLLPCLSYSLSLSLALFPSLSLISFLPFLFLIFYLSFPPLSPSLPLSPPFPPSLSLKVIVQRESLKLPFSLPVPPSSSSEEDEDEEGSQLLTCQHCMITVHKCKWAWHTVTVVTLFCSVLRGTDGGRLPVRVDVLQMRERGLGCCKE